MELVRLPLISDENLVSYWRLEGDSNDNKGSNNGTDTSIVYSTANGKFGQGAGFTAASNSRIVLGSSTVQTGDFTWAFWTKAAASNALITNVDYAVEYGYTVIATDASSKLQFAVFADPTSTKKTVTSNAAVSSSVYTHVACVRDGTNIKIYINGTFDNQDTWSTAQIAGDQGTRFGISRNGAGWLNSLQGVIDDIAIFSRALTAEEVSSLYNEGGNLDLTSKNW